MNSGLYQLPIVPGVVDRRKGATMEPSSGSAIPNEVPGPATTSGEAGVGGRRVRGPGAPEVVLVETEADLYWEIALEMYGRVVADVARGALSVFIVPVGPTFQYRRFVSICRRMPIDLSGMHLFFMDEYLQPMEGGDGYVDASSDDPTTGGVAATSKLIDIDSPLSFRGFVRRELEDPLAALGEAAGPGTAFSAEQIHFPDPEDPAAYDQRLKDLGGADVCFAGVGINGHMAFNEPPYPPEDPEALATASDFFDRDTRIVTLSRETVTINSNTALGGAWDVIPPQASTVGMKQILASRALRIYLNRPWQRAVIRRMLFGPVTPGFPASAVQTHPDALVTATVEVAARPTFGLR
jgi:glucosamine-6-phosphate deaminase